MEAALNERTASRRLSSIAEHPLRPTARIDRIEKNGPVFVAAV
jgi:hypothetical protein